MVIALALGAAAAYGIAVALQHRAAATADPSRSLRPALLVDLVAQPAWRLGVAVNVVAFALRAVALGRGSLLVVQPLVLSGLVVALVIESVMTRRPVAPREGAAAIVLVVGLSAFLVAAGPAHGSTEAPAVRWVVLALVAVPVTVVLARVARRGSSTVRAAGLAVAACLPLSATAALAKQAVADLGHHGAGALTTWTPYALVLVAGAGVLLTQSAFQAGPLRVSLPVISVGEPVASVVLGLVLFHERVASSAPARIVEVMGLAVTGAAVVVLTRGQVLAGADAPEAEMAAPRSARSGGRRR